jgi:hypothetical protein
MQNDGFNNRPNVAVAFDQPFLAHITNMQLGKVGGPFEDQSVYDWVEQVYDPHTGLPIDSVMPRTGTYDASTGAAAQPAIEPNNRPIVVGSYVYLKVKGFVGNLLVFEVVDFSPATFVKVTGTTTTDGFFPAILQEWNYDTLTWFEPQRWDVDTQEFVTDKVWVRDCNDNSLTVGTRYGSVYVGLFEEVQSYITLGGASSDESSSSHLSSSSSSSGSCTSVSCLEVIVPPFTCVEGVISYSTMFITGQFCVSPTGCGSGSSSASSDSSGSSGEGGTFPPCSEIPGTLDVTVTSSVPALDGFTTTAVGGPSTWTGTSVPLGCEPDTGFSFSCSEGDNYAGTNYGGSTMVLISQTSTSLTFQVTVTGGPCVAVGDIFVLSIP